MSQRIGQQWKNDNTGVTTTIIKFDGAGFYTLGDAPSNAVPYPPVGYTKVSASPYELADALEARCTTLEAQLVTTNALAQAAIARLNAAGIS